MQFGTDSAYFAFGDFETGNAIANIYEGSNGAFNDSHEFFFEIITLPKFKWQQVEIPGSDTPAFIVTTGRDGGLAAVWMYDVDGELSGILIDINGRAGDNKFLDVLIGD